MHTVALYHTITILCSKYTLRRRRGAPREAAATHHQLNTITGPCHYQCSVDAATSTCHHLPPLTTTHQQSPTTPTIHLRSTNDLPHRSQSAFGAAQRIFQPSRPPLTRPVCTDGTVGRWGDAMRQCDHLTMRGGSWAASHHCVPGGVVDVGYGR